MHVCCRMLSLLTPRQSDSVGGPIGSLSEAKTVASYPNYDAAYLAKRLGALDPTALERNRYKSTGQFTGPAGREKELVYLQNATKGYEAEAEECLKKEFKDWLMGVHEDNYDPQPYDNERPGAPMRRDMLGDKLDGWVPTWWGPHQLTYLPGVREYLREQAILADKNSLDLNTLAHLGPQNLEEAWAYFKHWVKGRPVGPEECLHPSAAEKADGSRPFRAGPRHMQNDTAFTADNPYFNMDAMLALTNRRLEATRTAAQEASKAEVTAREAEATARAAQATMLQTAVTSALREVFADPTAMTPFAQAMALQHAPPPEASPADALASALLGSGVLAAPSTPVPADAPQGTAQVQEIAQAVEARQEAQAAQTPLVSTVMAAIQSVLGVSPQTPSALPFSVMDTPSPPSSDTLQYSLYSNSPASPGYEIPYLNEVVLENPTSPFTFGLHEYDAGGHAIDSYDEYEEPALGYTSPAASTQPFALGYTSPAASTQPLVTPRSSLGSVSSGSTALLPSPAASTQPLLTPRGSVSSVGSAAVSRATPRSNATTRSPSSTQGYRSGPATPSETSPQMPDNLQLPMQPSRPVLPMQPYTSPEMPDNRYLHPPLTPERPQMPAWFGLEPIMELNESGGIQYAVGSPEQLLQTPSSTANTPVFNIPRDSEQDARAQTALIQDGLNQMGSPPNFTPPVLPPMQSTPPEGPRRLDGGLDMRFAANQNSVASLFWQPAPGWSRRP
jgi:hypothetical protein